MPNPKILVVDDDPALVRAMRLRLRANNYEVTTATDGYSAIASAQKERPALIVLDHCSKCARSSNERTTRAPGGRSCLFPEACRQRGIAECDSPNSFARTRPATGLAFLESRAQNRQNCPRTRGMSADYRRLRMPKSPGKFSRS